MNLLPILRRELLVLTRRQDFRWTRVNTPFVLVLVLIGVFVAVIADAKWEISPETIVKAFHFSFLIVATFLYMLSMTALPKIAVNLIGDEKDRRTFDFLLGTALENREIVLGKYVATLMHGLNHGLPAIPFLTLIVGFGGIDPRSILLTLVASSCAALFSSSFGLWCGVISKTARKGVTQVGWFLFVWSVVPIGFHLFLPRAGWLMPEPINSLNYALLCSGPYPLLMAVSTRASMQAVWDAAIWMCVSQLLMGAVFLLLSILQVRSSFREQAGEAEIKTRWGWGWRKRIRPAVGDDPIFWRERYTAKTRGVAKILEVMAQLLTFLILLGLTSLFAIPAFRELLRCGYGSGGLVQLNQEVSPLIRLFLAPFERYLSRGVQVGLASTPVFEDQARLDLNLYSRLVSAALTFFILLMGCGVGAESIAVERKRDTWLGVLATSMSSRKIVLGKIKASAWGLRGLILSLLVISLLAVLTGALHPVGFVITFVSLGPPTLLMITFGVFVSTKFERLEQATLHSLSPTTVMSASTLLSLFLAKFGLPFVAALGSPPLLIWIFHLSYRDIQTISTQPDFAFVRGTGLPFQATIGEASMILAAMFVGYSIAGYLMLRYTIKHFDRLSGRPWRASEVATQDTVEIAVGVPTTT